MFGWLFGKKKEEPTRLASTPAPAKSSCCDSKLCCTDPRASLASDEEWDVPEKWFTDTDGKLVRRKRTVANTSVTEDIFVETDLANVVVANMLIDAATPDVEPSYAPPYTPPDTPSEPSYTPPASPSYSTPSSCSSSSGSSCSSSSPSSCSSSSGSSCSSSSGSSCGGGGGGD